MNILLISTFPPRHCGIGDYTADMTRALARQGDLEISVLTYLDEAPRSTERNGRVEIIRKLERARTPRRMSLVVDEIGPDLIHFQSASFLHERGVNKSVAQQNTTPLITTVHDTPHSLRVFYVIPGLRETYRKSRKIVTHSQGVTEFLNDYHAVPMAKLNLVPLGVDTNRFHPGADSRRARETCKLDGKRIVLFFGFLRPGKGLETLFEAWAKIASGFRDTVLVIAGGSPDRARRYDFLTKSEFDYPSLLHQRTRELGLTTRVVFTGYVPEELVPGLLAAANVVVFPNDMAFSQSYPLQEALSAGAAIIATASPSAREVLVNGENAILVPPRNVVALSSSLDMLLRDEGLAVSLRRNARTTAVEKYSWTHVSGLILQLYRDVVQ